MTELWFRNVDARFPFLRDDVQQAAARWHGNGDGPAQYLADTPDGAWAELLRHEGIDDETDLPGVARDLWAIEVDRDRELIEAPQLADALLRGDQFSYEQCQTEARTLRSRGATALVAPAAGLREGSAGGQRCIDGSLHESSDLREGRTLVLFGTRTALAGWRCCHRGRPDARVIGLVRQL